MKEGDRLIQYVAQPSERSIVKRSFTIQKLGVDLMYITHGFTNPIVNVLGEMTLEKVRSGSVLSICFVDDVNAEENGRLAVSALIQCITVHNSSSMDDARKVYTEICDRLSQPIALIDKTKQGRA